MEKYKFLKLHENARIPKQAHPTDYGYDVFATSKKQISENVIKYGLGFAIAPAFLPKTDNVAIIIAPRSSIYKTGLVLSNSIGIVDSDYRGEISAIFYHVDKSLKPYEIGDKIGQLFFIETEKLKFVEAKELSKTERGCGGYGSTGNV